MKRNNFEQDYLKAHTECDYCKAMGMSAKPVKIVPRRIGESRYFLALCEYHYKLLNEIESEG